MKVQHMQQIENDDDSSKKSLNTEEAEQDLEDEHRKQTIVKRVRINNKTYTYKGPPDQDIEDLFQILEDRQQPQYSKVSIIKAMQKYLRSLENWFKNECSYGTVFNNTTFKATITFYDVLIIVTFVIFYILWLVRIVEIQKDDRIISSDWKSTLFENMPLYGAIFTICIIIYQSDIFQLLIYKSYIYGLVTMQVQSRLVNLVLFLLLFFLQLCLMLYDLNILFTTDRQQKGDLSQIVSYSFPMGLFIHWFIVSKVFQSVRNSLNEGWSTICIGVYCFLLPYTTFLSGMNFLLFTQSFDVQTLVNGIMGLLIIPVIIVILVSWILLHLELIRTPLNNIQQAITNIQQEIQLRFRRIKPPNDKRSMILICCQKNITKIAGSVIGIVYLLIQYYLIVQIVILLNEDNYDIQKISIIGGLIVGTPFFICLGICISVSQRQSSDTFLYFPIFVGTLPLLGLIPLAQKFLQGQVPDLLVYTIMWGPSFIVFFWLALSLCGIQRRTLFLIGVMFLCVFVAVPLGFIFPLTLIDQFGSATETISTIGYALIISGGCIIFIVILVKILQSVKNAYTRKKQKKPAVSLLALSYMNLRDFGFFINSSGLIIGYCLLSYTYFSASSSTISEDEKGNLFGLLIVMPILFTLINIALRARSQEVEKDDSEEVQSLMQNDQSEQQRLQIQKTQKQFFYFGFFAPFVLMMPFVALSNEVSQRNTFLVIMFGVPLSVGFYRILTIIKNKNEKYQNLFSPCVVAICWFLCFLPFGAIIPVISALINNNTNEYGSFMRILVGCSTLACIIGVSAFAVFFQLILNKIELERQRKFICNRLSLILMENSVKSDPQTLSSVFERYIKLSGNTSRLIKLLEKGNPVNWMKEKNKKLSNSHFLVTQKDYKILGNPKKKEEKPKRSYLDEIWDCLCCRIGMDYQEEEKEQYEEEELDIFEEILDQGDGQKVDDFLPKELKEGMFARKFGGNLKLVENLDKDKQELAMENYMRGQGNQNQVSREDVKSSKTDKLRAMNSDDPNGLKQKEFKFTEFGQKLQKEIDIQIELYHDIWNEFNNVDDDQQPSIIYNDWMELLRITNVYDPSDNETLLSKIQVDQIYSKNATTPWNYGIMALDINEFAQSIKQLAQSIYPNATLKEAMNGLCVDIFFVNLCHNFDKFALNYRSDLRSIIMQGVDRTQELAQSPFHIEKQFDVDLTELQLQQEDRKQKILQEGKPVMNIQNTLSQSQQELAKSQQLSNSQSFNKSQSLKKKEPQKPCHIRCLYACCKCMRTCCCIYPSRCCIWLEAKIKKCTGAFKKDNSEAKRDQLLIRQQEKRNAPPWEIVCDIMVKTIVSADEEYQELKKEGIKYVLEFNLANLLAIYAKIVDIFTISKIAFENNVPWLPEQSANDANQVKQISIADGSGFSSFEYTFYLSFTMSICRNQKKNQYIFKNQFNFHVIYALLSGKAIEHVQKDTLGVDKDGNKATFPHPQFFLTKALQIIGGAQFMLILKTFIDTFICNWQGEGPWTLYRTTSIQCLSDEHIQYMGFALVGIVIYYPVSTFMFPNFQFFDKSLDLKYDPSFLVIYIQAKLIVLGIGSFFSSFQTDSGSATTANILQLATASIAMFVTAAMNIKIRPCLISYVNIFETCGYLIAAILNGFGMLILLTDNSYLGIIGIGLCFYIILQTIVIYRKFYRVVPLETVKQMNFGDMPQIQVKKREMTEESEKQEKYSQSENEFRPTPYFLKKMAEDDQEEEKQNKEKNKEKVMEFKDFLK